MTSPHPMPRLEFAVLGPLAAQRDGSPVPLGGGRRALLLALLVIEAGRPLSRDRLIDELWGDDPPETAVTALHGLVSQLRRLLEDEAAAKGGTWRVLVGRGAGYGLDIPDEAIDARRFSALLATAADARDAGEHELVLSATDRALALWRGRPLLGLSSPGVDAFARRCEDERLDALEDRADALLGLGRPREALAAVAPLIESHPLRERLRATHVVALYRCGRQADALAALADARRRLRVELGVAPSPALDGLEREILTHDPALGAADRPARCATPAPAARSHRGGGRRRPRAGCSRADVRADARGRRAGHRGSPPRATASLRSTRAPARCGSRMPSAPARSGWQALQAQSGR